MTNPEDTIYALASGSGTVALSVIRVSGERSRIALERLAGGVGSPRRCYLRKLRDPQSAEILDEAVIIWIPGPASFTGEDCAELHIHGGRAVQQDVLRALSRVPGLRLAEPGEFTRRAVLNDKMDLVEAEGLGDLLSAKTAAQRRQAMSHMLGDASTIFDSWREQLVLIRAAIEATVDFADEHGVADEAQKDIDSRIRALLSKLESAQSRAVAAAAVRDGVKVILAGKPNTGKSSLLNALVGRDAAIVSAIPGTTRDAIEVFLDLDGIPVVLTDTAGLREGATDVVEVEGIRRSLDKMAYADIVVWVAAADVIESQEYGPDVKPDILVESKSDIAESNLRLYRNEKSIRSQAVLSTETGEGVEAFLRMLTDLAHERFIGAENPVVVTERQRLVTADTIALLRSSLVHGPDALELKAEDIRRAAEAMGRLTGRVEVEEWLGAIFSRFCIGK